MRGGVREEILERALVAAGADQVEACLVRRRESTTRFANNAVTQNVMKDRVTLTIRACLGQQVGSAATTDLTEEGIAVCAAEAAGSARAAPPDPEFLGLPGPQVYPQVDGWDPETASVSPADRAEAVQAMIRAAAEARQQSAGSVATGLLEQSVANTEGLRFHQGLTTAQLAVTAMAADGSWWAQQAAPRWRDLDPAAAAAVAVEKAARADGPVDASPGDYTVVLEPAATADFFSLLTYALDARAADEGRSAFSGKGADQLGVPGLAIRSDPCEPRLPALSIGEDGLPLGPTRWIEDGRIRTLSYGRYWARERGRPFTGKPCNFLMERRGAAVEPVESLVAGVERGLLVTRFWYIRVVDPMRMLLTGMTRDGLYLIENGRVTRGARNLRFNESPLACLARITGVGPSAVAGRGASACVPALRIDGFRFTSGTSF